MTTSPDGSDPLLDIGPNNRGPAVIVTAYILLIVSLLTTVIRLTEIVARKRGLNRADGCSLAASVSNKSINESLADTKVIQLIAVPQTVLVNTAVTHGLGRHVEIIPNDRLEVYYQV
jgi:hypothetical protein